MAAHAEWLLDVVPLLKGQDDSAFYKQNVLSQSTPEAPVVVLHRAGRSKGLTYAALVAPNAVSLRAVRLLKAMLREQDRLAIVHYVPDRTQIKMAREGFLRQFEVRGRGDSTPPQACCCRSAQQMLACAAGCDAHASGGSVLRAGRPDARGGGAVAGERPRRGRACARHGHAGPARGRAHRQRQRRHAPQSAGRQHPRVQGQHCRRSHYWGRRRCEPTAGFCAFVDVPLTRANAM